MKIIQQILSNAITRLIIFYTLYSAVWELVSLIPKDNLFFDSDYALVLFIPLLLLPFIAFHLIIVFEFKRFDEANTILFYSVVIFLLNILNVHLAYFLTYWLVETITTILYINSINNLFFQNKIKIKIEMKLMVLIAYVVFTAIFLIDCTLREVTIFETLFSIFMVPFWQFLTLGFVLLIFKHKNKYLVEQDA